MSNKTLGYVLMVVGVLLVAFIIFVGIHPILGFGAGFGLKKDLGLAVGVIALVAGVVMAFFMKPKKS